MTLVEFSLGLIYIKVWIQGHNYCQKIVHVPYFYTPRENNGNMIQINQIVNQYLVKSLFHFTALNFYFRFTALMPNLENAI